MQNSNYPRQDYVPSGPYPGDKIWGIVIIALSSLCLCGGVLITVGGAALGTLGAATATGANAPAGSSAMVGVTGGLVAIVGIMYIAFSAVRIAAGIGVMNSRRWGFILTSIVSALDILAAIINLRTAFFRLWSPASSCTTATSG